MSIEWDHQKASINLQKHGVDFTDAVIALEDDRAITLEDDISDEERYVTIGQGGSGKLLVVVFTYRGERIRIISARRATSREQMYYEEYSL